MKKLLLKSTLMIVALIIGVAYASAAGYTRTLSESLSVEGYKTGTLYNFQTNTPDVLPTTGDLRYRDGNIWGLHNFGSGTRTATVNIPVKANGIVVLQVYSGYDATTTYGSKDATLSTLTGYNVFIVSADAESFTISVPRYAGVVAALFMEKDNTVSTANYTVNSVCGETSLSSTTSEGTVGSTPTVLKNAIMKDGKKYIYVSDDAASKPIAEDGSTVVTVNYREAATWKYTLVDDKNAKIKEGSDFEGETIYASYPRFEFNKKDSTLVEADVTNKEYRKSFVLDANNKPISVAYKKGTQKSIVFYTEGENIEGTTACTYGNVAVRASNALTAIATKDVLVTKLPAGKYKLHVGTFSSKSSGHDAYKAKIAVGSNVYEFATTVNLLESVSDEIILSVTTPVTYLAEGSSNDCSLDYIFIEKTGYMEESQNPYGDWLEVDNDGPASDEIKSDDETITVDPNTATGKHENGMVEFPEEEAEEKGGESSDSATGINNAQTADAKVVGIYSANGAKAAQLQKGLNIVKLANGKTVKVVK